MITPILIQVLFRIGIIGILVSGIWAIVEARETGWGYDEWEEAGIIAGVLTLILGPIIWRVFCEILILSFRINETLTDIRKILKKKRKEEKISIDEDSF